MRAGRAVRLGETRPFGVRVETMRGEPMPAAGATITPIARRLAVWWPGGAWVYAWPIAVEYPPGQMTRIIHVRMRVFALFATFGLSAFAIFVARRMRDGMSAD